MPNFLVNIANQLAVVGVLHNDVSAIVQIRVGFLKFNVEKVSHAVGRQGGFNRSDEDAPEFLSILLLINARFLLSEKTRMASKLAYHLFIKSGEIRSQLLPYLLRSNRGTGGIELAPQVTCSTNHLRYCVRKTERVLSAAMNAYSQK